MTIPNGSSVKFGMEREIINTVYLHMYRILFKEYTQIIIIIIIIIIMVHRDKNLCNQSTLYELSSEIVVHTTNMDRKFYTFSI
jgi:hypothetical protein